VKDAVLKDDLISPGDLEDLEDLINLLEKVTNQPWICDLVKRGIKGKRSSTVLIPIPRRLSTALKSSKRKKLERI